MGPGLTDNDMDRIKEYLATPAYMRTPEQLVGTDSPERGAFVTPKTEESES